VFAYHTEQDVMSGPELQARQLEGALNKLVYPADVVVLLDGSGSVSHTQFEMLRLCIRQLVDMFKTDVRIAIIQFGADIKIECNLVADKQQVNCSITAMSQLKGNTNTTRAFELARLIFDTYHRTASRCIVLLTDGDCSDAIMEASKMRDTEATHIVTIGVNIKDPTNLARIASINSYFLFNSFDNLSQVFTHLNREPTSPPKLDIYSRGARTATLSIQLPPGVTKFKEWQVEMFDFQTNKWQKMGTSQAEIQCLHNLEPNIKYKLRAKVLLLNGTWTDVSEDMELRTLKEEALSKILRDPIQRADECKKMTAALQKFQLEERLQDYGLEWINILILGRMGAGKSCTVSSMASAINGVCTVIAPFRSSLETVTQSYKMFPLVRDKDRNPVIRIYDVYGWSQTNYKNSELGFMLDGYMKSGFAECTNGFLNHKSNQYFLPNPTFKDKIHAVIVVVSAITVGSTTEMSKLNEFYALLTGKGYQPIFVMTKVDKLNDDILKGRHENVLASGIVDATLETFCQLSNIPRDAVLPIINYTGSYEQPDYVVEMLVLNALRAAVRNAVTFLDISEDQIKEEALEEEGKSKKKSTKGSTKTKDKGKAKSKGKGKPKKDQSDSEEEESEVIEDDNEASNQTPTKKQGQADNSVAKIPTTPTKQNEEVKGPTTPVTPNPNIWDLAAAATYLGVDEDDVLQLLEAKEISGRRIGSKWRITKEAIDSYLNSNK